MLFFTMWDNLEKCEDTDVDKPNGNTPKEEAGDNGDSQKTDDTPGDAPINVPTASGAASWKDVPCSDPNAHIIPDEEYTGGQQFIRHYEADGLHWTDWSGLEHGLWGTSGKTLYYDMDKTQVDTSYTAPYRVMVIRQCLENGMLEIDWAPEGTRWIDSDGTYSE